MPPRTLSRVAARGARCARSGETTTSHLYDAVSLQHAHLYTHYHGSACNAKTVDMALDASTKICHDWHRSTPPIAGLYVG